MKTKKELINSWIKKAEKDLLAAQHELSFPDAVTESVCFHCQQVRYPEELLEPTSEEAKEAFEIATKIKEFVLNRIVSQ